MDCLNMANLPSNLLYPFNFDSDPFFKSELFPNNMNFMNSYLNPRRQNNAPIDLHTMGIISELAPKIHRMNVHGNIGDKLAYVPSTVGVKNKDKNFHVNIDVGLYAPEELSVKIVDEHLIIEGKHDERQADDIGYVSRHFMRRYELPKGHNPDDVVSKLSSDGVLTVSLPKPKDQPKERIVTIQIAGPNEEPLKKQNKFENNADEDVEQDK